MKIGTGKGLLIITVCVALAVLLVPWAILTVGEVRSGPRGPESGAVRSITQSILIYANAHDGALPQSLKDLNTESFALPAEFTPDMFIYVAPRDATFEMPSDTPLVIFPWESGIHIGYLGGNVSFVRGGYGNAFPTRFDRELRRWRVAFGVALLVNLIFLSYFFIRRGKRNGKPNKSGEGTA